MVFDSGAASMSTPRAAPLLPARLDAARDTPLPIGCLPPDFMVSHRSLSADEAAAFRAACADADASSAAAGQLQGELERLQGGCSAASHVAVELCKFVALGGLTACRSRDRQRAWRRVRWRLWP